MELVCLTLIDVLQNVLISCLGLDTAFSGPYVMHCWLQSSLVNSWWRHEMESFPRYWPFVRGIHRSAVNSPHKGQWRGAMILFLICALINGCVNTREAGDLWRHSAHYDVTIMFLWCPCVLYWSCIFPFLCHYIKHIDDKKCKPGNKHKGIIVWSFVVHKPRLWEHILKET